MKEKVFAVLQRIEPASKQASNYSEAIDETVPPLFALTEQVDFRAATLLGSEIRYRRLFEATRKGILILDPGALKIIDANPGIATCTRATAGSCISQGVGRPGLALKTLSTDHFPTGATQNCPRADVAGKPVAGFSGAIIWSCRSSAGHREASTARHALKGLHRQEWAPNERRPDCCEEKWLSSSCSTRPRKNTKLRL